MFSWKTGKTEAGRTVSGSDLVGIELVAHHRWLRAGLGSRLGYRWCNEGCPK